MEKGKVALKGCVPFLVAIAMMYGITLVVVCVFQMACSLGGMSSAEYHDFYAGISNQLSLVVMACVHLAYIILFYKWFQKRNTYPITGESKKRLGVADFFFLIGLGVALQFMVSALLQWILPFFPELNEAYEELYQSLVPGNNLLAFIITGFLAPVGEELIFRGVTISLMEESLPFVWVNLIQAFLFGFYHMNLVQFLYAFAIGIVFGLVYKKYRNIKACIWVHGTINLLANIISFIG